MHPGKIRGDHHREQVRSLTQQGMSARQIAAILHITPRTVTRYRHDSGVSKAPLKRPLNAQERALVANLVADECPIKEIARTVGRNSDTIARGHCPPGYRRGTHRVLGPQQAETAKALGLVVC